ncbi:hypothetical protein Golax_006251 [Gossypium laxum]|uniref:CCHC-type domain-containing protein n=1 Tax=Gossypium laxum TaxID=34288 RepID=A0A7J9A4N1_9ROSI|nr:hypothetical protein [Gossypium laxum]
MVQAARIASVIDLNKSLISFLGIDGFKQRVEYEGLPTICYECGRFGHFKDNCQIDQTGNRDEIRNRPDPSPVVPDEEQTENSLCGPWMQENDVQDANSRGGTTGTMQESHTAAWNNKESHMKESRRMEVGSGSAAQGSQQVIVQQTTLDGDKHKAVMVVDEDGNDETNILARVERNISVNQVKNRAISMKDITN